MPVMDGYEATKIIRQMDSDIPIIGLTAKADERRISIRSCQVWVLELLQLN